MYNADKDKYAIVKCDQKTKERETVGDLTFVKGIYRSSRRRNSGIRVFLGLDSSNGDLAAFIRNHAYSYPARFLNSYVPILTDERG